VFKNDREEFELIGRHLKKYQETLNIKSIYSVKNAGTLVVMQSKLLFERVCSAHC